MDFFFSNLSLDYFRSLEELMSANMFILYPSNQDPRGTVQAKAGMSLPVGLSGYYS